MIIRTETPFDIDALSVLPALSRLRALGGRFGFRNRPELIHEGIPQEVFPVMPFDDRKTAGTIAFHEGFPATA